MRYRKKEENLYRQENIGDYYILKTSFVKINNTKLDKYTTFSQQLSVIKHKTLYFTGLFSFKA